MFATTQSSISSISESNYEVRCHRCCSCSRRRRPQWCVDHNDWWHFVRASSSSDRLGSWVIKIVIPGEMPASTMNLVPSVLNGKSLALPNRTPGIRSAMLKVQISPVRLNLSLFATKRLIYLGGKQPSAPELHAVARAGANVTAQWSGIIKMHNGPAMTVCYISPFEIMRNAYILVVLRKTAYSRNQSARHSIFQDCWTWLWPSNTYDYYLLLIKAIAHLL